MYAVIWMDAALDALADAYVAADLSERDALEKAVLRINAQLASDPIAFGESRPGKRRIGFDKPCAIYYVVNDPSEGVVRVTFFWTY